MSVIEWTDWQGGKCPIPEDRYIEVMYRNDETDSGYALNYDWEWVEDDADNDIVAYRTGKAD